MLAHSLAQQIQVRGWTFCSSPWSPEIPTSGTWHRNEMLRPKIVNVVMIYSTEIWYAVRTIRWVRHCRYCFDWGLWKSSRSVQIQEILSTHTSWSHEFMKCLLVPDHRNMGDCGRIGAIINSLQFTLSNQPCNFLVAISDSKIPAASRAVSSKNVPNPLSVSLDFEEATIRPRNTMRVKWPISIYPDEDHLQMVRSGIPILGHPKKCNPGIYLWIIRFIINFGSFQLPACMINSPFSALWKAAFSPLDPVFQSGWLTLTFPISIGVSLDRKPQDTQRTYGWRIAASTHPLYSHNLTASLLL